MNEGIDHEFRDHLRLYDNTFLEVIRHHPVLTPPEPRPPFEALVRIVAGQQLSVRAAATVFDRLKESLNGGNCQISRLCRLEDIANGWIKWRENEVYSCAGRCGPHSHHLQSMLDLPWGDTNHTHGLKALGHGVLICWDVWIRASRRVFIRSGLRVAMQRHLGLVPNAKPEVYQLRAETWKPFRTMASLHLWHSLKPDHERYPTKI